MQWTCIERRASVPERSQFKQRNIAGKFKSGRWSRADIKATKGRGVVREQHISASLASDRANIGDSPKSGTPEQARSDRRQKDKGDEAQKDDGTRNGDRDHRDGQQRDGEAKSNAKQGARGEMKEGERGRERKGGGSVGSGDATGGWNPVISATKRAVHLATVGGTLHRPTCRGLLDCRDERASRLPSYEQERASRDTCNAETLVSRGRLWDDVLSYSHVCLPNLSMR